jgi:hypothetical protein
LSLGSGIGGWVNHPVTRGDALLSARKMLMEQAAAWSESMKRSGAAGADKLAGQPGNDPLRGSTAR